MYFCNMKYKGMSDKMYNAEAIEVKKSKADFYILQPHSVKTE